MSIFYKQQTNSRGLTAETMTPAGYAGSVILGLLVFAIIVGACIGGCSGFRSWQRGQKRADAHNKVQLTHIAIQTARQQAEVVAANNQRVKQEAYQRYLEAVGIRRAQDEISKTLTPLYVQHEAIQAQEAEANKPNSTVIYVPSGPQGVPLVATASAATGK